MKLLIEDNCDNDQERETNAERRGGRALGRQGEKEGEKKK